MVQYTTSKSSFEGLGDSFSKAAGQVLEAYQTKKKRDRTQELINQLPENERGNFQGYEDPTDFAKAYTGYKEKMADLSSLEKRNENTNDFTKKLLLKLSGGQSQDVSGEDYGEALEKVLRGEALDTTDLFNTTQTPRETNFDLNIKRDNNKVNAQKELETQRQKGKENIQSMKTSGQSALEDKKTAGKVKVKGTIPGKAEKKTSNSSSNSYDILFKGY